MSPSECDIKQIMQYITMKEKQLLGPSTSKAVGEYSSKIKFLKEIRKVIIIKKHEQKVIIRLNEAILSEANPHHIIFCV